MKPVHYARELFLLTHAKTLISLCLSLSLSFSLSLSLTHTQTRTHTHTYACIPFKTNTLSLPLSLSLSLSLTHTHAVCKASALCRKVFLVERAYAKEIFVCTYARDIKQERNCV